MEGYWRRCLRSQSSPRIIYETPRLKRSLVPAGAKTIFFSVGQGSLRIEGSNDEIAAAHQQRAHAHLFERLRFEFPVDSFLSSGLAFQTEASRHRAVAS